MNIALAQMHIAWEDKAANYKKAEIFMREASTHGTEAVFFPEMSFTGFSMNTAVTKETEYETVTYMKTLARQYQMYAGFGWVKDCGQKCENHYTIVDKEGSVLSDYAKLHPFSYSGEDEKFQGGSAITYFQLKGMECSSFICYDLRFPEIFQQASKSAQVILVPANWPAKRREHWKTLLKARAIENQVYVLAVNCVGETGGLYYSGDSGVFNPNGELLVSLSEKEGCLYCELPNDAWDFREAFPVKRDRREELYQALYVQSQQEVHNGSCAAEHIVQT
ncbi:MAG: carbon-nitrogen family hydrolase [Lachnospiraceae bacterium]|nr:carbon-nitrogen family hydrolase [Lachnospiraceae bacterium]